ncbi:MULTISPECIES: DNA cytosine methyltransferase [unclassified Streptomyces]|uniref:DNA cytosine methyltransferase n=1 Tax=unclassified Streptomyces TaxID=2593676 RepID=UPI002E34537F|nr:MULTISPECIES: DNA (cytosine-5-)-methyltransferase [unclassified Streptomyces]WUC66307.1 DNA cytosine methyltransferase [Streptomyces sp. NBC_00539]
MDASEHTLTSIEICAGAGGQAIGLHQAGFSHLALVEIDRNAAKTLTHNIERRPGWSFERKYCEIITGDVKDFEPENLKKALDHFGHPIEPGDVDLLAGGVPCPPFSHAGKQLGKDDERDLFPTMLDLVDRIHPKVVMIENVRGIKDEKFQDYRDYVVARLEGGRAKDPVDGITRDFEGAGYKVCGWKILEASNFGVPQLRPRAILVAIDAGVLGDLEFEWPAAKTADVPVSVFRALEESMENRFAPLLKMGGDIQVRAQERLERWRKLAGEAQDLKKGGGVAPTLVGGSKKHGGADLGPSRAKAAWASLGVSGLGVANEAVMSLAKETFERDLLRPDGPMLTVSQAAIIQGFPEEWEFDGGKTAQYRQVGNAFPPPVAKAVGEAIADVLRAAHKRDQASRP